MMMTKGPNASNGFAYSACTNSTGLMSRMSTENIPLFEEKKEIRHEVGMEWGIGIRCTADMRNFEH